MTRTNSPLYFTNTLHKGITMTKSIGVALALLGSGLFLFAAVLLNPWGGVNLQMAVPMGSVLMFLSGFVFARALEDLD